MAYDKAKAAFSAGPKLMNEIERLIIRLKRFRQVFTRGDKPDSLFSGFIYFAMIIDAIFV